MAVTLKDIAERLEVSVPAVSLALNKPPGTGRISPELRERIIATAREMGYQPNRLARALVHGRSRFIGLLMLSQAILPYSEALRGIDEEAAAEGYGVLLCGGHGEDNAKKQLETFAASQVEGIIAVASSTVGQTGDILARRPRGVPLISINREINEPDTLSILMDYCSATQQTTEFFIRQGHRRIAYLDIPGHSVPTRFSPLQTSIERRDGYLAAMQAADLPPIVHALKLQDPAERIIAAAAAARELLCGIDPPTAFCTVTDWEAVGVLRACAALHISVPGDVAVFGSDNREAGQFVSPSLSTVQPPFYEAGQMAVRCMRKWHEEPTVGLMRLPCRLIFRESTSKVHTVGGSNTTVAD